MDLAVLLADVLSNLRKLLAADCHHLHQKGSRVNTILAMDMALYCQTAGGFAANDSIGLLHLCGNILKAHRHLIAFLAEALCHLVQHMGSRQVAHRRAAPAAVFQQIIIQHDQNGICVKVMSLIINHTQTVRITIGGNTDVTVSVQHIILKAAQRAFCRSRHLAAKQRIMLGIDSLNSAAGNGKDRTERRQAHTVHRINGNTQVALPDGIQIDKGNDVVQILIHRVHLHHPAALHQLLVCMRRHLSVLLRIRHVEFLCLLQIFLNICCLMFVCVAAASCEYLDTVVDSRIVTGCYHHAIAEIMLHHIEHDERGRGTAVHKQHPDSLLPQYFTGPDNSLFGKETPVITDHHRLVLHMLCLDFQRHGQCKLLNVFFRKLFANDGSPATSAKFYHNHTSLL